MTLCPRTVQKINRKKKKRSNNVKNTTTTITGSFILLGALHTHVVVRLIVHMLI